MAETRVLAVGDMEALIARAMRTSGVSEANAGPVARALTQAEIDGRKGHGFSRVPSYARQARSGKVQGGARPSARRTRPGALLVDAAHGFFYPAFELVLEALPPMARECGVGVATVHRSHHSGANGWHVERLAEGGLVALMFGNTPRGMAPWGGKAALYGTNPIAFAAPRRDGFPVVVDLSLTTVARGNIMTAARAGTPIPEGWALDEDGNPTSDPERALRGILLPAGGPKGAALALMVELLAGPLAGAALSSEASSFFTEEGPPPGVGQTVVALDPEAFAGRDAFLDRVEDVLAGIEAQEGARVPGGRTPAAREAARRDGLPVPAELLEEVLGIAAGEVP